MLTKATSHQLRAAHTLRTQGPWQELGGYIRAEIAALQDALVESRDETVLRQLQGRAQALREFQKFVETSSDILEKAERPSGGTRGI